MIDYMTADGKVTRSSVPRPQPFIWGQVLRVHRVGDDYAFVEYVPNRAANVSEEDYDPSPLFSVFVRGARGASWETSHSCRSLDAALLTAIAWRAEQRAGGRNRAANSQAAQYIAQMLQLPEEK